MIILGASASSEPLESNSDSAGLASLPDMYEIIETKTCVAESLGLEVNLLEFGPISSAPFPLMVMTRRPFRQMRLVIRIDHGREQCRQVCM
jgi:hypothetical protein